jgi:hypothetical protein
VGERKQRKAQAGDFSCPSFCHLGLVSQLPSFNLPGRRGWWGKLDEVPWGSSIFTARHRRPKMYKYERLYIFKPLSQLTLHVDFLVLELSIGNIYDFPLFGKSFYAQSTDLPSELRRQPLHEVGRLSLNTCSQTEQYLNRSRFSAP